MATLKKEVIAEFELTPESAAEFFCMMDEKEMARFFNEIGKTVQLTWDNTLDLQMAAVERSGLLNRAGIDTMKTIGTFTETN